MRLRSAVFLLVLLPPFAARAESPFRHPERVRIVGYSGHAMEPFISRDGRYLLFNNLNDPSENTELHWAERVTPVEFRYGGIIAGTSTPALEGVPTLDRNGLLYFVSPRSYEQSLSTIYRAKFEAGRASGVELVAGLSLEKPGMVNFDVEISADGQYLYGVDGDLTGGPIPKSADLFVARRTGSGFERLPDSGRLLVKVNTDALEYAAAISPDGLELFFTRMSGALFWRKLTIERAVRTSANEPFGRSRTVRAIKGHVEGPSLSGDGKSLYYHMKVDGTFAIYRVTRP